jgi:tripartite-type tricarboxylate transporter receptor subunit TctC
MNRFFCTSAALAAATMSFAAAGLSQEYPTRAINVIIPHGPGGTNDIVGRIVFEKVAELTGYNFVLENRAGAGSTIGEAVVANSPADGYTLMVHSTTIIANAHLGREDLTHNPRTDFVPIAAMATQTGIIGVHPSVPVETLGEFIEWARSRPGETNYSSAGAGSYTHMAMAYFDALAETEMVHVPFGSGSDAALGLAAGNVDVYVASFALWTPFIERGDVRLLASIGSERMPMMPDLPSANEYLAGYEFPSWVGVFAPAGMPEDRIATIHSAVNAALADPEVQERFDTLFLETISISTEAFAEMIESDHARYEQLMSLTGIQLE